ncbi:MAG TPA: hypothetical protein VEQ11_05595, partial [Chloroflexota bacterium]|nr:hypothetical protein [Chloroflexota bacterium]
LAAEAAGSKLYKQYDPDRHTGPLRPEQLPGTDLANAFRLSLDSTPAAPASPAASKPTSAPKAATAAPAPTATVGPAGTPQKSSKTPTPGSSASATPVPGTPPEGDPKGIVIKLSEAGKDAKEADHQQYADGRQTWYAVRYERPQTFSGFRSGPVTVYSKAIIASDVATAQDIFNEQVALNQKFPEAKEKIGGKFDFALEGDEYIGEQAQGFSACNDDCNSSGETYLHHRLVFRNANMVGVIYTWGIGGDTPEGNKKVFVRQFAEKMVSRWS